MHQKEQQYVIIVNDETKFTGTFNECMKISKKYGKCKIVRKNSIKPETQAIKEV